MKDAISAIRSLKSLPKRLWLKLPSGGSLPEEVWRQRHRFLTGMAWLHALAIALTGPSLGYSWELSLATPFSDGTVLHTVWEGLIVAVLAAIGSLRRAGRTARSVAISLALTTSSATLVHLSGGYIELHFHFFVMLAFLALYQDWIPYLLAIGYVAAHHGIVGTIWPEDVYNHTAALNAPWTWAAIHAFFILWSCAGSLIAWRFNENATARTRAILHSVGNGVLGLDRDGKVIFVNPVAGEILGRTESEMIGRPIEDILTPMRANPVGDASPVWQALLGWPNVTQRLEGKELLTRADGTEFPVEYVSTPMIERGEAAGAVVSLCDVTARERALTALRESERQYQDLVHTIDGIVWEADAETFQFTFLSRQAERILGYSVREWLADANFWAEHIHPDDRRWAVGACANATREKRNHRLEYRMTAGDGRVVWIGDLISVILDDGRPVKLRGIMFDITQRKLAEESVQYKLKCLKALHEISVGTGSTLDVGEALGILVQKAATLLPYAATLVLLKNEATGRLERSACFNISRAWLNKELSDVPPLVEAAMRERAPVVTRNIQTDPRTADPEYYRRHGLTSAINIPLRAKEDALGVLVFLTREEHEFTEEEIEVLDTLAGQVAMAIRNARHHSKIRTQAAELEKMNARINDFTAMIAHDLRSPLHNVIAIAEMMNDGSFGPITEEQNTWIGKLIKTGHGLVDLVSDFLDVTKIGAGRIDLRLKEVDLAKLLGVAADNHEPSARKSGISLHRNWRPSPPAVQADPRRIDQVLSNLLSNALKFTPAGGTIELGAGANGGGVNVWVRDTGEGIAAEDIDQLFEKYKQSAGGQNSKHKGTGLGLAICKMIVEAHGGRIRVESAPGQGATFTFMLPMEPQTARGPSVHDGTRVVNTGV